MINENTKKANSNLIVVLGPTATGKTNLSVGLAAKLNGEIISADSRQVYKGMNIGTGKDYDEYTNKNKTINYHLIDILDPSINYSVYHFQKDFFVSYNKIVNKGKLPLLCGGTGLYIESILQNYKMADVSPNHGLRKSLNSESHINLINKLKILNPSLHNKTDISTKKRTIRAIEIALANKKQINKNNYINSYCVIGINPGREQIKKQITKRLKFRLKNGLIEEVKGLLTKGLNTERLNYFGLEYKFINKYLSGEYNQNDMFQKLNSAIHQFAKRQMTFFRRMEKQKIIINWLEKPDLEKCLEIIHQNSK